MDAKSLAGSSSSFLLPPPPPPPPTAASSEHRPTVSYRPEELDQQKVTQPLINYVENVHFPYINDFNNYERIVKIGQGTFGEVIKAKCKKTGKIVALKKILMENEKEGFPITALREVKLLQRLKHPNITELLEICSSKATSYNRGRSTFYLVFKFCEHDLAGLLHSESVKFQLPEIKGLMKQLLNGLYKIHMSKILHRDMKSANVLISKDGVLKLADFGLARPLIKALPGQPDPCYTNRVVTLWYRPPELLLGDRHYGIAIDNWGAGCIMAELWTRSPIMQGETEQQQLTLISQLCGSINPTTYEDCDKLPLYGKIDLPAGLRRRVIERLQSYVKDAAALDLIDNLLALDPKKRIDADRALNHRFFWTDPMPGELKRLMSTLHQSMFEYTATRGPKRPHPQQPPPAAHSHGQSAKVPASQGHMFDRVF
uniref:Protein kinase domain-containing protein n=1 Tax=Plectus sambesii TaxID=2011161 RepID=A0A914V526_9BILA